MWVVRIFKTRSIATQAVKENSVWIKEDPVKPARELKVGEVITYKKDGYRKAVEVLGFPKSRVGAKLVPDYVRECTSPDDKEKNELLLLARSMTDHVELAAPLNGNAEIWKSFLMINAECKFVSRKKNPIPKFVRCSKYFRVHLKWEKLLYC